MRSMATKSAARRQAAGSGRDIQIPLPTSGLFSDAKDAEISGMYAAKLENFRTGGTLLELRRDLVFSGSDVSAKQRYPYEFAGHSYLIALHADRASANGIEHPRAFAGDAMAAYISSTAVIVDGTAAPLLYNGAAFSDGAFTTSTSVTQNEFDGVVAHHDRLYFWKSGGALEFYHGDVGAISGALTRFALDRLGNITGKILTMMSLTIDAGSNTNDVLCIITTTGHAVVYSGLDPSDPTDWSLVTRVKMAPPMSRFAATHVGSDVWVITSAGIVSVAQSISQGALALVNEVSRPIAREVLRLINAGPASWQLHTAADGSHIIVNRWDGVDASQFIFEVESKSWTTATYPAAFWHNLGVTTSFTSTSGFLAMLVDNTTSEPPEDFGFALSYEAVWHTSWFTIRRGTRIASITPTIIAKGPLTLTVAVLSDHDETAPDIAEAEQTVTISPDNDADNGGTVALHEVIPIGAVGSSFQLRIRMTAEWARIVNVMATVE